MTNWVIVHLRLVFLFALLVGFQARADNLDADSTKKVVLDKTWTVEEFDGPGNFYWTWNSDGTLCLRLHGETGNCDDTGHWTMKDGRVCYELGWWGKADGMNSECFRVSKLNQNRYGAFFDSGLTFFKFAVPQ